MANKPQTDKEKENDIARVILKDSAAKVIKDSMKVYGMEVIENRAIPSILTGLKPVQTRILYSMHTLGLSSNKPYVKCAKVVGDVLARLHP